MRLLIYSLIAISLSGCVVIRPLNKFLPAYSESPNVTIASRLSELINSTSGIISVAPFVTSVNTSFTGFDVESWKVMIATELTGKVEEQLQKKFNGISNFRVVDRMAIKNVLGELFFSTAISSESLLKLDRQLGVKYLIAIDFRRYPQESFWLGTKYADHVTMRLIEVETGAVLITENGVTTH